MKSAVIVFPGSNREGDAVRALRDASGKQPALVWHRETELPPVDLILIPGGFSYGDYLRCGSMAAQSPVMREVAARAEAGVHVMGICNGYQVLTETGLLPGVLMRNAGLKFVCRQVHLKVETADAAFTRGYAPGQVIRVPVAHNEGNYFADQKTLDRLEDEDRVAFRYASADGAVTPEVNPNGSQRSIAGILNGKRNVLGMMPHPEDAVDPLHGGTDGRGLFAGLAEALA